MGNSYFLAWWKKIARRVVNIYKKRMQIEQNFRDDKNSRWGYGFELSRTRSCKGISILLLISMLVTYVNLIIGSLAESMQWHRQFQANTIKVRIRIKLITELHENDHLFA